MNIYTISFLLILIFSYIKNRKSMYYLQQNLYIENNKYIKWIINNKERVFLSIDLLSLITIYISYIMNNKLSEILVILALAFYILESIRILSEYKEAEKEEKIVATKRIKRLIVTTNILYLLPIIIYLTDRDNYLFMLLLESTITYFNYILVLIAKIINTPLEKLINKYYKTKALEKLNKMTNINVIGIVGSYGKTSSKNILYDILSTRYITNKTIRNLTTEYATTLTVNNYMKTKDQMFIADIGTYNYGNIKNICSIIKPKYGIVTNVGIRNLENFDNSEEAINSKFELIEALPSDGVAILNKDDPKQVSHKIKNKCKKVWISIDNEDADIRALDITCNYNGSKFKVLLKNTKKEYEFETKLLGKYNIYNILSSIALALELGISITELQEKVKQIKQINGRLELIDYKYMYKLDDSHNTNPVGAKVALDVLKMMPGEKMVVTRGISEINGKEINRIYGTQIAKIKPDYVILVGERKTKNILTSLLENNYSKDKVFVVKNVDDAYSLIQTLDLNKKVYALFEQELSNSYNE